MNKKSINNKGFTLVELLAVIVILAVLVLVAMPAVTSMMERSRSNSFVTESMEFAKGLQTAYTDSQLTGAVKNVNSSDGKYYYFCMTVQDLVTKGYIEKNITGYSGIIEGFIPTSINTNKAAIYVVSMTNSNYVLNAQSLTNLGSKSYTITGGGATGLTNSTCATTTSVVDTRKANYTTANNFN